jgi:polyhydroxybutyrate depolymerase
MIPVLRTALLPKKHCKGPRTDEIFGEFSILELFLNMRTSIAGKIVLFLCWVLGGLGILPARAAGDVLPARIELKVDGVDREALVFAPADAKEKAAPVIFAFHGHGGTAGHAARTMAFQKYWPEAIVVYPQGLKTKGVITDPAGDKPGWQYQTGADGDRDYKFFDALLAKLRADYKVDLKHVFATGHSNGGAFVYMLWAERGSTFAAVAPCAAVSKMAAAKLKPKPVFHLAGKADPLVKFEWQEKMMKVVKIINGCTEETKEWAKNCTLYPSKNGTPLVAYIHEGGHEFPTDAAELIVKFFKEYAGEAKK